jgi:hypothetical protein
MFKSQAKPQTHNRANPRLNPFATIDVNKELRRLDKLLAELRVEYEQFFLAIAPHPPDRLHNEVKRLIRRIRKAPFKRAVTRYRLRVLQGRYHTYNDYWQRTMREKEEGTYARDVFKANLRERMAREQKAAATHKGSLSKSIEDLFHCYKTALEKQSGAMQNLDFAAFQEALIKKAKAHAAQTGVKKLSFQVVVKDGKVMVRAKGAQSGLDRKDAPPSDC